MNRKLTKINVTNVKEVILEGLKLKIAEQGELSAAFDLSMEYPSRETFDVKQVGDKRPNKRRIVVRRLNNTVSHYAIGNVVDGEVYWEDDGTIREELIQGWLDDNMIEVSVWSPDSKDRDNIMELVKLWMLELEQDISSGDIVLETPFMYDRGVFSIRFLRAYEDVNRQLVNLPGVMYIGSLVFEVKSPFFHRADPEYWERYKAVLVGRVVDCIRLENSA